LYFRFLLAIAVIIFLFFLMRWFQRASPQSVKLYLKRSIWTLAIALVLFLAATGRLHWIFALFASLLPLARRLLPYLRYLPILSQFLGRNRSASATQTGPSPGKASQVETRFVRMTLNHDTGEIEGLVLEGQSKGRQLSEMSQDELLELWRECQTQDAESARLVQAYLDNIYGQDWHEKAGATASDSHSSPASGTMSREEACKILGLAPDASKDEIKEAHRRLMQKLHPDRGGSTYLAAKINQAKDALLNK